MVRINKKPNVLSATCLSREVLDLIADKWTALVVYALKDDTKRYNEVQRTVGGITQKVLTATLRRLERNGMVERTVYPVVPPKVEYKLTRLGKSLLGVLMELNRWAEEHLHRVDEARKYFDQTK